jgi:hypothetical protein
LVALKIAWSGYHFSSAARAGRLLAPTVDLSAEFSAGAAVDEVRAGSLTHFAYAIAIGILPGTAYETLNWLAAPQPVRGVAQAQPRLAPPHHPEDAVAEAPQAAAAADD